MCTSRAHDAHTNSLVPKQIILLATFLFLSYSALYSLAGIDACFVSELAKFRTSKAALRAALTHPKHLARWVDYFETKRSEVAFTLFGGLALDVESVTKFITFQVLSILISLSGGQSSL